MTVNALRNDNSIYFGRTLKFIRQLFSASLNEVCEKINLSPSYMCELENGKKNVSMVLVDQLAKLYKIEGIDIYKLHDKIKHQTPRNIIEMITKD